MGLSLLASSYLPTKFFYCAFETIVYMINRLPTRSLQFISRYWVLHDSPPNYSSLWEFGCHCFSCPYPYTTYKLNFRSPPCVFSGYLSNDHGYCRCFGAIYGWIFIAQIVIFDKQLFPCKFVSSANLDSPFSVVLQVVYVGSLPSVSLSLSSPPTGWIVSPPHSQRTH